MSKKAVKGADRGLVPTVRRPVKDYFQGGGLEQEGLMSLSAEL